MRFTPGTGGPVALAFTLALTAAGSPRDAIEALEGRHARTHRLLMLDGSYSTYLAEDVVEIARIGRRSARIGVTTHFPNGHSCTIEGKAVAQGGALVLAEARRGAGGRLCRLTVRRLGDWVDWSDGGGSCASYCGMRGSLTGRMRHGSSAAPR